MQTPNPTLTAFLVCDSIIVEKGTNKKSLIGIFTDVYCPSFPSAHPNIGIYFCLTDAEGDYEVTVRLVHSDTDSLLAETSAKMAIQDQLSINDFALNLPWMVFKSPGRYEFQLYCNKELRGRKEFRVNLIHRGQQ